VPFLSESAHLYLIARCLVFQSSFIFFTGMLHKLFFSFTL